MPPKLSFFCLFLTTCLVSSSFGKYVEGEITTLEDWQFITRFCFLSAKGTLKFTFEYPVSYGPQHILLYFDTPDQWDAVYKSDKTCDEKLSVLSVDNHQIINLTTSYGMSGCAIRSDGMYECVGGRIFRSSRERWWFVAVSRCDRGAGDTCAEKLVPLSSSQNLEITTNSGVTGCVVEDISGVQHYVCRGARGFRSARERWWYVAVSGCDKSPGDTCAEKVSVLDPSNNQIIYLTTQYSLSGCVIETIDNVDHYVCSGGRRFRSSRERWWYVAVSRCDRGQDANCSEREAVMNPANNQIIYLMPYSSSSGCKEATINGVAKFVCSEGRTFIAARERWWYIAVSHCQPQTPIGISLKYKIHMTNGQIGDYLHREYSADEFYILPIDIAFLIAYVILCIFSIICAVLLRNRQLWHTTYKMYMVSVGFWTMYLFLMSIGYGIYGNDGLEYKLRATKYAARACESISVMVFLLMLILIGKGYTITRGKLSMASTIKISVFMTLFVITYIIIFIWEAIIFDPGLVLYLYESPPGYALIAMRIIGYVWFCYAVFFTLKHYPEKGKFYYPLFVFYTLWFWAGPIVIVIAMFAVALWSREKSVVGVENLVALCGHIFFMILTRPSAANKNFPYHVRTTQIGILENAPHYDGGCEGDTMGRQAYAVSDPMQGTSRGPDLTSLFVTSQTKSEEKQKEAETSMATNGTSNGLDTGTSSPPPLYNSFKQPRMVQSIGRNRMNSSAHLIGNAEEEYEIDEVVNSTRQCDTSPLYQTEFPMSPSAPPPYESMFQVRGSIAE